MSMPKLGSSKVVGGAMILGGVVLLLAGYKKIK